MLLRHGELHDDRADLVDHDDAGIGGACEVTFVDHADAGTTVDRRDHGGVGEHRAQVGDVGILGLGLGIELQHLGALGIDGLLRDHAGDAGIAFEIAAGVGQLGVGQRLLRDRLIELRFVGRGIEFGEHVALLHVLALFEFEAEDLAVDLGAHGDAVAGARGADAVEIDRHISEFCGCGEDRHGDVALGAEALGSGLLLRTLERYRVVQPIAGGGEHREPQQFLNQIFHVLTFRLAFGPDRLVQSGTSSGCAADAI